MGTAAGSSDPKGLFRPKLWIWDKSESGFGWASRRVRAAGCSTHRFAWRGEGRCSSYPPKNTSTGKGWRQGAKKEQELQ